MGRKRRSKKQLKKSIPYFIVEGCTEENYIKLLKIMYKKSAEIKNANGGNASGVMSKALKIIKNNLEYTTFIVWFDNDKFKKSDEDLLNSLSEEAKVIQSYPCIEAWLLAHFEELQNNQLSKQCKNFEKKLKNNSEYTTFIVWFDNDKFYNSDNNVLDTLSKKATVIQSYPLKDYQKNNCTQLKNNIDEIKINLSKSNYPKYTGNIEEILNKFI